MRASVRRLEGIGSIVGDWHEHTVRVEYEPGKVTIEEIQAALDQFGYDSTVVGVPS